MNAALIAATFAGFQLMAAAGASASEPSLLKYAQDPSVEKTMTFKPFKVASRRSRRRNRALAGFAVAGIAALIISEAVRSKRKNRAYYSDDDYYYDNRSYNYRSSYPGRQKCYKWANRCDYGNSRACRKWNRRCR